MRISLTKIVAVIVIIAISIVIARISSIIQVKPTSKHNSQLKKDGREKNKIGNTPNHLIWFVQISDIHISIFHDKSRVTELREFCDKTVGAIRPYVVLASGDLTDAKTFDSLGSQQFEDEWKIYKDILDECKVSETTVWLDVRGNHDNFNVPSIDSQENYFRNYSVQGKANPRSYLYQLRGPSDELYSFIALDACLDPGPRRPFNFIGVLTKQEVENVRRLISEVETLGGDYTIWFGHYPTSCILASDEGVRSLIGTHKQGLAYLCGHLHTLLGTAPTMYTLQQDGFLELELADWKDNRKYRIMAVDHGLLSFVDVDHGSWPVALVTNPKHALFVVPDREPLESMLQSTHIRLLAFSLSEIANVSVRLNDGSWQYCDHIEGPLYVSEWNATEYAEGIHHIHVHVIDSYGRETTRTQPFSLDGSRLSFKVFPRLILMTNISIVCQILCGLTMLGCVVPLCALRVLNSAVRGQHMSLPRPGLPFFKSWYRKLWTLANLDRFYYPLVLYPLYLAVGPWSVGEVIEGHYGVIFAWGTFVRGTYLPGDFTYAYAYVQLMLFQTPLTLVLAHRLERRLHTSQSLPRSKVISALQSWWRNLLLIVIVTLQITFAYFFWLSFGSVALLLGPFRTWPVVMSIWLWRELYTIPVAVIQEAVSPFTLLSDKSAPTVGEHSDEYNQSSF